MDTTQAPGKKPNSPKESKDSGGAPANPGLIEQFSDFCRFMVDTWAEFRKISWPTRQQVQKETGSVLILVALITCSVLAFDYAIAKTVFEPLDKFSKHMNAGKVIQPAAPDMPVIPMPGAPQAPAIPNPASTPQSSSGAAPQSVPTEQPAPPAKN